jgi:4-hydroxybenzoate polyprenyltransferase
MDNQKHFLLRFLTYQKERFPFLVHGLLIAAFSFSAISYSRLCRGEKTFIGWAPFLNCIFITITLFFLVRIFDEFKDKEDDAKYRKYLPVPRGLIKLSELKIIGIITFVLQLFAIFYFHVSLLYTFLPVIIYLCLMGKEFFIENWLRERQFWYVVSHMFIIPFVDIYASGYDWFLLQVPAPKGLLFFFAVSYMNGIVLEIGRKIKTPALEEEGVKSYTYLLGTKKAIYVWLAILFATLILAIIAAVFAHHNNNVIAFLIILFFISSVPALLFLKNINNIKAAKWMEYISVIWTFAMYLSLGGVPMFLNLIGK